MPEVQSNVFFGGGASFQPIHLDELHCSGSEATLLNCTHGGVGVHDCDHPEDIGIICQQLQGVMVTIVFFFFFLVHYWIIRLHRW